MKSLNIYNLIKPLYELDKTTKPDFLVFLESPKKFNGKEFIDIEPYWAINTIGEITTEAALLIIEGHLTSWCIDRYDETLKFSIGSDGKYYPRYEIEIGDDPNTSKWFCGSTLLEALVDCAKEFLKNSIAINAKTVQS